MWIIAIIAMLCWSGSDIFSKIGSKQEDKLSHYKVGIAVGLIMGIHAIYEVAIGGVPLSFSDIIAYLPTSAFYIISMVVGYVGLRYIELSISSPICNGSGAVTAIMCMLVFGVTFNPDYDGNAVFLNGPIIAGIAFIVIGIIALGFIDNMENDDLRRERQLKASRKYTKSFWAIFLPVLYCILDSCGTFVDTLIADSYVEKLGDELLAGDILNTAYEFTWLLIAIVFAIYVFVIKKDKLDKKYDGTKLLGGICETVGQVFYMMVIVAGYVPGYVIISAYCAVSMVWGRIFLKEKLSVKHYVALALAFAGIIILGIYDV
jgi:drug/metabolite transporter (DMT)-like permease